MRKFNLKNIQWGVLLIALGLSIVGLVAIFCASYSIDLGIFKKQIIWLVCSVVVCIGISLIDYNKLVKISPFFYVICLLLFVGVLFTKEVNGAHSWYDFGYFSFQPTEIAKPIFILFVAFLFGKIQKEQRDDISKIKNVFLILLAIIPTFALIILEPDYGTAITYFIIFVLMIFIAGLDKKYFLIAIPLAIIGLVLAYQYVLPSHAKDRLNTYLNPESDPLGSGYNVIQSKLAIGAGELTGMGLLKGNQTQLGFLSPKTTDFIFSVIGEEMGFLGACLVIVLFVGLLSLIIYISKTSKDRTGQLISIGVFGMFFYHIVENIGMTMGLLPITGVPLPFISYGGSSLMTNFICIGILLNISSQRQKAIFIGKK